MNSSIKTLLVVLFFSIGVSFFAQTAQASIWSIYINKSLVKKTTDVKWNEYQTYMNPEITIIKPKDFSFIFNAQWTTAALVAREYSCSTVLNGTYFWRDENRVYFPAGVRYSFWNFISSPKTPIKDPNLKVLLASDWKKIQLYDNDTFDFSNLVYTNTDRAWYLNAGPWLVRDGRINHNMVTDVSHWQRTATRSWILINPNGEVLFLVATKPVSIPQFITFAYVSGAWTGEFQLVNIDGWSSTSLLSPAKSFYPRKKLPSFICVQ